MLECRWWDSIWSTQTRETHPNKWQGLEISHGEANLKYNCYVFPFYGIFVATKVSPCLKYIQIWLPAHLLLPFCPLLESSLSLNIGNSAIPACFWCKRKSPVYRTLPKYPVSFLFFSASWEASFYWNTIVEPFFWRGFKSQHLNLNHQWYQFWLLSLINETWHFPPNRHKSEHWRSYCNSNKICSTHPTVHSTWKLEIGKTSFQLKFSQWSMFMSVV